jgi:hypothetical protein
LFSPAMSRCSSSIRLCRPSTCGPFCLPANWVRFAHFTFVYRHSTRDGCLCPDTPALPSLALFGRNGLRPHVKLEAGPPATGLSCPTLDTSTLRLSPKELIQSPFHSWDSCNSLRMTVSGGRHRHRGPPLHNRRVPWSMCSININIPAGILISPWETVGVARRRRRQNRQTQPASCPQISQISQPGLRPEPRWPIAKHAKTAKKRGPMTEDTGPP